MLVSSQENAWAVPEAACSSIQPAWRSRPRPMCDATRPSGQPSPAQVRCHCSPVTGSSVRASSATRVRIAFAQRSPRSLTSAPADEDVLALECELREEEDRGVEQDERRGEADHRLVVDHRAAGDLRDAYAD